MDRGASTVIGFAELVDFPKWGIVGLRGKIDTGAKTSALHVSNIRETGDGNVGFDVRLHRRHPERVVHVEAAIVRRGSVRPSSGVLQTRLFVSATLRIGAIERQIELNLVDRKNMIYRMLVGRSAIGHGVFVDPNRKYVLTRVGPRPGKSRQAASE
jgi:ribosomal protein S6--L-glutamate ligase